MTRLGSGRGAKYKFEAETLDAAGTYTYNCSPHPWMIGQVIVP